MTNPWTEAAADMFFPILVAICRVADGEVRVWPDMGCYLDDEGTFDNKWNDFWDPYLAYLFKRIGGEEDPDVDCNDIGKFEVAWIKHAETDEVLYTNPYLPTAQVA